MEQKLIEVKSVTKKYNGSTVLDNISFDIYQGEIISFLGVNGAGKSTLSSLLSAVHPPTSGDILFKGSSIYQHLPVYRRQVGYCPQKPNLHPCLTVQDQLYFSGSFFGLSKEKIESNCNRLMEEFGLLFYKDRLPKELSGGYKQRCLIARSLMHDPTIIVFDELTVGLDQKARSVLWDLIKRLKAAGNTLLITTHYLDEADALSDRICFLHKGKVKAFDTPQELKKRFDKETLEHLFGSLSTDEVL